MIAARQPMAATGARSSGEITALLRRAQEGDQDAKERLIEKVYGELRKLAGAYLRRERPGHSLQPTALVNEAYLKLAKLDRLSWQDRSHFFGVAAHVMRQVLVDHARARRAEKRGGGVGVVPLDESRILDKGRPLEIIALNEALERLHVKDPRAAKVIECRFFGGLSVEETAEVLGIAARTVKRDWNLGRAWLRKDLSRTGMH
jgi:RNA polymerase sigma factor (TIGR02999 family)